MRIREGFRGRERATPCAVTWKEVRCEKPEDLAVTVAASPEPQTKNQLNQ